MKEQPFFSWLHAKAVIVDLPYASNLSSSNYKGLPTGIDWKTVFGMGQHSLLRLQYQLLWHTVHAVVKHHLAVIRSGTQVMPLALFLYATA